MSAPIVVSPAPGAGWGVRLAARIRGWLSRRALLRLAGVPVVVLQGRSYAVRAVPLGVARDMVPALLRCSKHFAAWDISEALYDDLVTVLALGLGTQRADIIGMSVTVWDIAPAIEVIARVNGLTVVRAGNLGELVALTTSNGTPLSSASSVPPDGPSSTSPIA